METNGNHGQCDNYDCYCNWYIRPPAGCVIAPKKELLKEEKGQLTGAYKTSHIRNILSTYHIIKGDPPMIIHMDKYRSASV